MDGSGGADHAIADKTLLDSTSFPLPEVAP